MDRSATVVAVILFEPAVARDVLDALRLLEGKLAGTKRRLEPGTIELRRVAERSGVIRSDHRVAARGDDAHDDAVLGLLTYDEVAHRLHVSEPTVRRYVAAGRLPIVRLGRAVRVRPQDLAAFIEALPAERNSRVAGGVVVLPGSLADTADRAARRRGVSS